MRFFLLAIRTSNEENSYNSKSFKLITPMVSEIDNANYKTIFIDH